MNSYNIDTLKLNLIARITAMSSEEMLLHLQQMMINQASVDRTDVLNRLNRPMLKKLDIDEIMSKQGFKSVDRTKFNELVHKMNIKESLSELLATV
ncbi:MAG: hypothetical protein ACOYPR_18710 [Saprospiraceae bacterium]